MERLTATLCDILDAPTPYNCPLNTLQQSVQFVAALLNDLPVELGVSLPHILTIATVLVRQGGDTAAGHQILTLPNNNPN